MSDHDTSKDKHKKHKHKKHHESDREKGGGRKSSRQDPYSYASEGRRRCFDSERSSDDRQRGKSSDAYHKRDFESNQDKSAERQTEKQDRRESSTASGGQLSDFDFSWEQHRYTLNQIFFTDSDYIKR